jgi:hypothetical protein
MDGVALAEKINERWAELSSRIVSVSGDSSLMEARAENRSQAAAFTKPVSEGQLDARIIEVLESTTRRR